MALSSPRFVSSRKLQRVAREGVVRKGARGRHVHLVQMALIDLGHPMPGSTWCPTCSPDGIFGDETEAVVWRFQGDHGLVQDGVIGRNTMAALDRACAGYLHNVILHFRSLSLTNVPFPRLLQNCQLVYGQYAIEVKFGSGVSLGLSPAEEQTFARVGGECEWLITSGEMNRLHAKGPSVPPNEIKVYYVRRFVSNNLLGCGGHAENRPACTVAATASQWDTAHEVCHVLLTSGFQPVHIQDRRNLMFPTSSNAARIPVLTDSQVRQVRNSVCCRNTCLATAYSV